MADEAEKKLKIIIVDDDDFLVDMYATKFGASGAEVVACKSGASLFEKLGAGEQADLILLDIVIPQMNGLEILKHLREKNMAEGVPIVMLTNQNDEKDVALAQSLGVAGYIVKSSATPSEVVEEALKVIKENKKT